jgi:hypothetical protein
MNQPYIIYYKGQRYLDFYSLLYIYALPGNESSERSSLWRYLKRTKIRSVRIKNQRIFLYEDIFGDPTLVGRLKNICAISTGFD